MTLNGINVNFANIGWDVFSDSSTRYQDIATTTYNEMITFISNMWYDKGVANLAGALQRTQAAFQNSPHNSQKVNIIIMGSNPYIDGTTTQEICQYASGIKKLGVTVVFIGIGETWQQERIDCIVGNAETDVINVTNYNNLQQRLSDMYQFLCPIDKQIKITEAKPVSLTNARFIEFINMGIQIESSDTLQFNGLVNGQISGITIQQGQYVVLYNSNDGIITCNECGDSQCTVNSTTNLCQEAIYISCDGSICSWDNTGMDTTNWNIQISDTDSNVIDMVQYNANTFWPKIRDDYSYSLENAGFNNQYGANYVRSCSNEGTPGAPSRTCTAAELQCQITEDCTYSGNSDALCSSNTCICTQNSGFYPKRGRCYPIPEPTNCIAHIVKNGTQPTYTRFAFTGADIDSRSEQYAIRYYQTCYPGDHCMTTVTDYSRIKRQPDLNYQPNQGQEIAGYAFTRLTVATPTNNVWDSARWKANCSVLTQSPTPSPTPSPTKAPTTSPTNAPSNSPTWQTPHIFLSGDFCDRDRCGCNNRGFECCLTTDLSANCTQQRLQYTVGDDVQIFHSIKIVPESFPYDTLIHWRVDFNGTLKRIDAMQNGHVFKNISDNSLGITVEPSNGSVWINGSTSMNIALVLNESAIICADNTTDCKDDLVGLSSVFKFALYDCATLNAENIETDCNIIYPSDLWMVIGRSDSGGDGGIGGEDEIESWIWIVLAVCGAALLLLAWLLHRYWYKGRKISVDYKIIQDDIEFQEKHNEEDIATRLQNADTNFNPLATGMPGVDRTYDPLTAERQKRAESQQSDMVETDAVKNVFKEEMGQTVGKQSSAKMKQPLLR